ncbi:hypothetical protein SAMN04487880_3184 [Marinobacter sp. es.042]|nr:hypothetical protein SAMN04487880_3184 [Marinobacter sp. es.042]
MNYSTKGITFVRNSVVWATLPVLVTTELYECVRKTPKGNRRNAGNPLIRHRKCMGGLGVIRPSTEVNREKWTFYSGINCWKRHIGL